MLNCSKTDLYGKIDEQLCLKRSTVQNVVKKGKKTGTVAFVPRSCRPCLISPRLKSALCRNFLKDRKVSAPKLASELKKHHNITVSTKFITRALKLKGLRSKEARKKSS